MTDRAPREIPPGALLLAKNVIIESGILQRDLGSIKWNIEALPSPIVAAYDYWPDGGTQYRVLVTRDGKIYRYSDPYTKVEIVSDGTSPETLTVSERVFIVEGGRENVGSPAKLFIMTGNNPIQVISGFNTTRSNISSPAADWGPGNYPFFGIIYFGRLFVFGNTNRPHYIYGSSDTNQEDFSSPLNLFLNNVFPGEGQRLQHGFIYKGRLHVAKYPRGVYGLQIQDIGDPATWYFQRIEGDIGTASVNGGTGVLDDYWMTTADGNIASLAATFSLGEVEQANVLKQLAVEQYIKQISSPNGVGERQAFWYPQRKQALFLYREVSQIKNGLILKFDFQDQAPKLTLVNKQFVNCIAVFRDSAQVERLAFGGDDGFLYEETLDRVVGELQTNDEDGNATVNLGTSFLTEVQTPHLSLGTPMDKNFDFVEIEYIPTGAFNLQCDVFIDGNYSQTKSFYVGRGNQLDVSKLDLMRLQARATRRHRLSVNGRGRTISLRFYTEGLNENFKLTSAIVSFKPQGQNEKGAAKQDTSRAQP